MPNEKERVCIACGCSDTDPCESGCGWHVAEGSRGVCSRCATPETLKRFKAGNWQLTGKARARVAERTQMRG